LARHASAFIFVCALAREPQSAWRAVHPARAAFVRWQTDTAATANQSAAWRTPTLAPVMSGAWTGAIGKDFFWTRIIIFD
jgi:hypothetical protein